ncbi:Lipid A biosynthesis lauroyl acyltransferase [Labilithrix luteola]|uniref:Lipid A biosynthesis lauroyl acyltransferase n=1 Tax=Labilithrix luteola TaxID=1391654 RepID=A0A0K1Q9L4_9BACT|nr:lysophospholipid acyltransferase family protein [Labilithrix luteola]AKV02423.1 Lipid A biosynthesis lauroyl acyltransferase [Labilithrix luteola]
MIPRPDEHDENDHQEGSDPRAHERLFWRRLAHWGASRGPEWWVRYSPPVFGWAAAALVPKARRAVRRNLREIRGPASLRDDARDVLATFATYASCLAEVLSNDADGGPRAPNAVIHGGAFVRETMAIQRGIVIVTAHTAGWETVGPLLGRDYGLPMMLVMANERDGKAQSLQDGARKRSGLEITHVGSDPLASLPLLRHLRAGGVVALQLDRAVAGMRTRSVELLGRAGEVPEGPLRLAQLSGAPILPVFCARTGYRQYVIQAFAPRKLERRADDADLDQAAQYLATCMTTFLRAYPTQWFKFA